MKTLRKISFALALLTLCTSLASCNMSTKDSVTKLDDSGSLTYVSLRINPEAELVADSNGTVIASNAINEDAEVVLAELDLNGKTIEEAGEAFTDKAVELGYLDVNSNSAVVYTDVECDNAQTAEKLQNSIADRINKYFDNHGIYGKVSSETLEKYSEQANEWNVSVGHAKMILRILDIYPEMSVDEILEMTVAERIALVGNNQQNNGIAANCRDEYKSKIEALKTEYAEMFALSDELDELRAKLANTNLTDEEKEALTQEIADKAAEFVALHDEYKARLTALKNEYREQSTEIKAENKKICENKKSENAEKLNNHNEKFEADSENQKAKIKQWRKGQDNT